MASVLDDITIPDERAAAEAGAAAAALERYLRTHPTGDAPVKFGVVGEQEAEVEIPAEALRVLVDVLGHLARGNAVTVAPLAVEVTTQQAAALLNVSRPFVVKLLDDGQLPFRKVGNRRRVRLVDVLAYRRRDDEHREQVLRRLTEESEALDLYK